jgi:putative DNA primase/helicase
MKPKALPVQVETIPEELKTERQWVAWCYEWRKDKWRKVLKNPSIGTNASSINPASWRTFVEALTCYRRRQMDGIGFVFSLNDRYAGIDLDKCRDPFTGCLEPWALKIVQDLNSYTEVSPSGTGVKIFMRGKLPTGGNRKGRLECYDHHRYFTVTGHSLPESSRTIGDRQAELTALHMRIFQEPAGNPPTPSVHHDQYGQSIYVAANGPGEIDEDLISRALGARNGTHFAQLWSGDTRGYESHSEADAALCPLLAFWTGPDEERIDRLFRQSGLYREKWERTDYREATIALALSRGEFWAHQDRRRNRAGERRRAAEERARRILQKRMGGIAG